MPTSAFIICKPTSISYAGTFASVNDLGYVSFSAVTSLSLDDVFSSTYDNYMIICRFTGSASTTINFRWRASQIDDSTTSSYVTQELTADNATLVAGRYTTNLGYLAPAYNTQRAGFTWHVFGPKLAQPTVSRSFNCSDYLSAYSYDASQTHNQSTAYDGFTLNRSSGTVSGKIAVYGCNQ